MRFSWSISLLIFTDLSFKNDLGVDRASFVTAGDVAGNSVPVDLAALDHERACRRPGTAAYAAAQKNQDLLSAWNCKCALIALERCT